MISITIDITNGIEEESFISTKINKYNYNQIANYINRKNSNQLEIYNCISSLHLPLKPLIDLVSYFQITDLENIEDYTNSIIPIIFIPFNNDENECYYCKRSYSTTLLFKQKYCKHCLMLYIKYTVNDNLDLCSICDNCGYYFSCNRKHEPRSSDFCTRNIKEWCNNCSEILCFKQIVTNNRWAHFYYYVKKYSEKIKNCKLCEIYNCISRLYLPLKPLIDLISYSQIANLENMKDSSNPIIPIMFIPFNNDEDECCYCKRSYSTTLLFKQKYCKHCLILYTKYTASNNLDVHITTIDSQCSNGHKSRSLDFCIQNIHEWCNSCSEILCFKKIVTNNRFYEVNNVVYYRKQKLIENEKDCKLCGKSIYQQECLNEPNYIEFKLCSDCYQIFSGWIESTLTKKSIPVLYLPWWDAYARCITCD
ncbi:hypothetical protein RhiirC2_849003 [Rhizophagus irregularis]|uniref:Uncharacterized protein n=1 Tax=Rhizophagus irregularis TaxID=588596 RepID=A0A2N1NCN5_9GLOM|nr:hypothetical protein RhiirC2_849003 [Rhizophagus irregularis]